MKKLRLFSFLIGLILFLSSCSENENIDTEKPVIDITMQDAFPVNCDTLYFGETVEIKLLFSDNTELGSSSAYSIDIHNNFDHHSHSTEVTECELDPIKDPVNPYVFIESYDIPSGLSEYETNVSFSIPSSDGDTVYDEGDYHFYISLTDKEGWSTQMGLSIKMLYR